jgi:hypothetical protein
VTDSEISYSNYLPSTGNVNLKLLQKQTKKNNPAAIRELGRYILKYGKNEDEVILGRLKIYAAACMADRGASWLLAIYHRTGRYGFIKDIKKSEYWRIRTEDRLRSDASLIYDDESLSKQAVNRYRIWCKQWRK